MITCLLTGFEPFDGARENPSRLVVQALASDQLAGLRIVTLILPVTYDAAYPALRAAVLQVRPNLLIATGQAGGRSEISVERIAINVG